MDNINKYEVESLLAKVSEMISNKENYQNAFLYNQAKDYLSDVNRPSSINSLDYITYLIKEEERKLKELKILVNLSNELIKINNKMIKFEHGILSKYFKVDYLFSLYIKKQSLILKAFDSISGHVKCEDEYTNMDMDYLLSFIDKITRLDKRIVMEMDIRSLVDEYTFTREDIHEETLYNKLLESLKESHYHDSKQTHDNNTLIKLEEARISVLKMLKYERKQDIKRAKEVLKEEIDEDIIDEFKSVNIDPEDISFEALERMYYYLLNLNASIKEKEEIKTNKIKNVVKRIKSERRY